MDVDRMSFRSSLLRILKDISESAIITFDLEMSGITTKGGRTLDLGKPSLQKQYEEMKDAAETYQVLQVGITCVSEDLEKEYYLAKPYNFTVTPLQADGTGYGKAALRLNRDFTFSSSAAEFLGKNGFDFAKVFKEGVPYLSRDEEIELLEDWQQRGDKNARIPDLNIAPTDIKNLKFIRSTRETVSAWFDDPIHEDDFVNIADPAGSLTGMQRRLVHQLIRSEFPTLRTYGLMDGSFMQVVKIDPVQEQAYKVARDAAFKANIARQTGLRWIFEALCGGDLTGIDSRWFTHNLDMEEAKATEEDFKKIVNALKKNNNKKHIIVGHNLFFDLGFLYKTFIGVLPNNVKHFQEDINELFPFVIDTKYLATQGPGLQNPRSGLKDLLEPFRKLHVPLVVLHEEHVSYGGEYGRDHEAGYDSWMTAELFVKLAAQLFSDYEEEDSPPPSPFSSSSNSDLIDVHYLKEHRDSNGGVKLRLSEDLIDLNDGIVGEDEDKTKQWLPGMNSKFWDKYVNKLRVNSTDVGVCDLAERDEDGVEGVRRHLSGV